MKHLDLFSGIGGFALAARNVWGGEYENVGFCDNDLYCQKVLLKNFPNAKIYGDIKKFKTKGITADIVSGGFPCQPFSNAGDRKGEADDRYLWPQMFRIIRELSPRFVLAENVRGLTNWNNGMVFDKVQADLEAIGYEVFPVILPACSVGAPHRRDRIWFIAHLASDGKKSVSVQPQKGRKKSKGAHADRSPSGHDAADSRRKRIESRERDEVGDIAGWVHTGEKQKRRTSRRESIGYSRPDWLEAASDLCGVDDGIPAELDGLKLTKAAYKEARIKSLGNAIVPQVAEEIFKIIKKLDREIL